MRVPRLDWLPPATELKASIRAAATDGASWDTLVSFARHDLDLPLTERLARLSAALFGDAATVRGAVTSPVRLLLLGTPSLSHLGAGIVVGGLRRGLHVSVRAGGFGQYLASFLPDHEPAAAWDPTHVMFAFDARFATGRLLEAGTVDGAASAFVEQAALAWAQARRRFGGTISLLQVLVLPVLPRVVGSAERFYGGSAAGLVERINALLAERAASDGVLVVDPASVSIGQDPAAWYDPVLWHKAKQEISPLAAPLFGDLVGRVLGAEQGRSAKCLVLDLDDTIWGGVIGDDGLSGIVLGQGSPAGEAFLAVQDYALALSRRGVILAVCSKNDEANALLPFGAHPEMRLKRSDIAAFATNWNDKASNLRSIAQALDIGLDALVLVDDNPFERRQVRDALPSVWVPELPDDPALVPACLADGGFFETLAVTADDLRRRSRYEANAARQVAASAAGDDIGAYLAGLRMVLTPKRFDAIDHERIVQLVNKTNQFNLTTKRRTSAEIASLADDPDAICLCFRLRDVFGDSGMIAVLVARHDRVAASATIDTWLMSCRVLGRGVEAAILQVLVDVLASRGVRSVIGEYEPTEKNAMVRDHYASMGFEAVSRDRVTGAVTSRLDLRERALPPHTLSIEPEAGLS